ncbi:MAG: hypothetical protein LBL32_01245, partial [Holosporales bacterium]|nr:hypothetical protein [Holosporales bacterium]
LHFDKLDSTNDYAIALVYKCYARNKIGETAILADTQTDGRGRLNKKVWISTLGNFHCSYIINIEELGVRENQAPLITAASVSAVRDILITIAGPDACIRITTKLPNDILVNPPPGSDIRFAGGSCGKKVAGILVEVFYPYAIVGVGINLQNSPVKMATNIMDEFKIRVKPIELVDNLYKFLIDKISIGS